MFCWVSLRGLVGHRLRPCIVHPKTVAGAAMLPLLLCPTLRCPFAPLFHLPCPSSVQAAQDRDCYA